MKNTTFLFCICLIWTSSLSGQNEDWQTMVQDFYEAYENLNVAPLRIAYLDNLSAIGSPESLKEQEQLLTQLNDELKKANKTKLSQREQLEYDLLEKNVALHLERIALEQSWHESDLDSIPAGGLATIPNGKAWYAYFLKRWIDFDVTPDQLYQFGLAESERVYNRMQEVERRSGLDSLAFQQFIQSDTFFYQDVAAVQQAFEAFSEELGEQLPHYFPGVNQIPEVGIAEGQNARLAQVPAFYSNGTFYYNVFDKPYNKRQIAWVYLHEALPGHHYERSYSRTLEQLPAQGVFYPPAYAEGWAAYVEEIGYEIGAYKNIYDELGKWEWDIIRSVRVALDVGLNYYDWTDEKAIAFWQKYIQGKDDIARREIARMKRWPCQVITYKYGANKLLNWKARLEKEEGFTLKSFHEKVLQFGPLPYSILEKQLFDS